MLKLIKSKVPARIDDLNDYLGKSRGTGTSCATHQFCNESALAIMEYSGNKEEVDLIRPFLAAINDGALWADRGYRNITHFFNPLTKRGLWNLPSVADSFRESIKRILKYGQKANPERAMFYTGAAAHLLQDMCVPHHSCNLLFSGHAEYEHWVEARLAEYPMIPTDKRPVTGESPMKMFLKNALLSIEYIDLVTERATESNYKIATEILLPLAQHSTAKMLVWIAQKLVWIPHRNIAL
jgi:phospholipase C